MHIIDQLRNIIIWKSERQSIFYWAVIYNTILKQRGYREYEHSKQVSKQANERFAFECWLYGVEWEQQQFNDL